MAKVEIEVRGPLTKEKFQKLNNFFHTNAIFKGKSRRLSVCYTILRSEDKDMASDLDIRARITDGEPELVIKVGKWRGSDIRKEVAVQIKRGEFSNLIAVCATLGYTEAIVSESITSKYEYKGVEFSLVDKAGHSYFFEAEILADEGGDKETVQKSIQNLCQELNLSLFSDEQFFDYIKLLNKEANIHFDWHQDGENFFRDKYGF
ncbi:MAG: hypothetical protein HY817_03515 [Candidatus Abawacabacteria bacterium]|nr:hypothetical protein [Candidatus Abawacabacteria bacterium]